MENFLKNIYIFFFMELVSSRDEFPLFEKTISPFEFWKDDFGFKKIYPFTLSPLSYLLSPRWQKLSYICNNFFYYNNLSITFLNYRTIKKSPFGWLKSIFDHFYNVLHICPFRNFVTFPSPFIGMVHMGDLSKSLLTSTHRIM